MKTSIVFTAYSANINLAQMSMTALANIRKYTDPDDYELIVIDNEPKNSIKDDYGALKLGSDGHYIINEKDIGYPASMNQGAKLANGEFLLFMENDILVWENWLPDLKYYLKHDLADTISPDQIPRTREEVLNFRKKSYEESMMPGIQEQGMIMMRKELFEKTGGWEEKYWKFFCWPPFTQKLSELNARVSCTTKVQISHICGATVYDNYSKDKVKFDADMKLEADMLNKEKNVE